MSDIVSTLRAAQAAKTDQTFDAYRDIIAASLDGELDAKAQASLAKLVEDLGFTLERVEADIAILKEAQQIESAIAASGDVSEDLTRFTTAAAEMEADHNRKMADMKADLAAAQGLRDMAQSQLAEVRRHQLRLADIHADHSRLFGTLPRSELAKRRHIRSRWTIATIDGATYPVIDVELLFANPVDLSGFIFEPLPGQTQADIDALLGIASAVWAFYNSLPGRLQTTRSRAVGNTHIYAVYPVTVDAYNSHEYHWGEALVDQMADNHDDELVMLLRHPLQTEAEFAAIREDITVRKAKAERRRKAEENARNPWHVGRTAPVPAGANHPLASSF